MTALVAACGTWPRGFGGWMLPWLSGGHPRGTTGLGLAQGRRAATSWCFPCSHGPRPQEPPEGVQCAGSITGQTNPPQTSERQHHATLSCVPPFAIPPSWLLSHIHVSHSGSLQRECPLRVPPSPAATPWGGHGTPEPEGMQVLLAAVTWDRRAEEHLPPVDKGTRALPGTSPGLQS